MRHTKNLPTSFIKKLLFIVKIEGESAWPALLPSSRHFATGLLRPKIGDFVVFKNPKSEEEIFVKKVSDIRDGLFFVESVLPGGSSSREFGLVPERFVLGKIICRKSI
jgi:hypothetical protein